MRNKHRQLLAAAMAYLLLLGTVTIPQQAFSAASGNYTDLLPIGAASDTTVISRGSGWALTTLAPSQTFGDALSRAPYTAFQSTSTASINATTTVSTFTALSGLGYVGSTTFPASWVATGRSIRITTQGTYATVNAGSTWTWQVKLGTTSVLTTGAMSFVPSQTTEHYFKAQALITVGATGNSGTVRGSYEINVASGTAAPFTTVSFSTVTTSAATVDLTSQLTVNPTFTWGAAASSMTVQNVIVEFLN